MDVRDLPLVDLRVRLDGRPLQKNIIPGLMDSLQKNGFLQPLIVRPIMVQAGPIREVPGWEITAGRHRFEAASRLRNNGNMQFDTAPCVVLDVDERHSKLAELDENLCRAELSAGERAKYTAQRKTLVEAAYPETRHGGARVPGHGKYNKNNGMQDPDSGSCSFIDSTAKATGRGRTTVSRDAERGEKINGKALDALAGTTLDKGIYLDQLKIVPMEKQMSIVEQDLAKIEMSKKSPAQGGRPRAKDSPITSAEPIAIWLIERINREEIPTLINLLDGKQTRLIIAALRRMLP